MAEEKKKASAKADEKKEEETPKETEEKTSPVEETEVKEEKPAEKKEEIRQPAEEEVPSKFKELVEKIENLSVLELSELVKVLEERLGVSAAAPVAMPTAGAASAGGNQEEASQEKSEYTVELKDAGEKKIEVIKAVRTATGKGLKEAKDLVDAVSGGPQVVKEGVPTDEAKEIEKALKEAGAQVELK